MKFDLEGSGRSSLARAIEDAYQFSSRALLRFVRVCGSCLAHLSWQTFLLRSFVCLFCLTFDSYPLHAQLTLPLTHIRTHTHTLPLSLFLCPPHAPSLLEEQYSLSSHLRSLRRFFLLEHGDFFIQVNSATLLHTVLRVTLLCYSALHCTASHCVDIVYTVLLVVSDVLSLLFHSHHHLLCHHSD